MKRDCVQAGAILPTISHWRQFAYISDKSAASQTGQKQQKPGWREGEKTGWIVDNNTPDLNLLSAVSAQSGKQQIRPKYMQIRNSGQNDTSLIVWIMHLRDRGGEIPVVCLSVCLYVCM